jgi:cytochrome c peroxidase
MASSRSTVRVFANQRQLPRRKMTDMAVTIFDTSLTGPGYLNSADHVKLFGKLGGVGTFLTEGHLLSKPSMVDQRWVKLAPGNQARVRVPTLRNVDKRPYPTFVKTYMHNGYFTS